MDKQSSQNPRKFEPHKNYQPYGVKLVSPTVKMFPLLNTYQSFMICYISASYQLTPSLLLRGQNCATGSQPSPALYLTLVTCCCHWQYHYLIRMLIKDNNQLGVPPMHQLCYLATSNHSTPAAVVRQLTRIT